ILLYDAHFVPVGKDQLQHIEMTRDVASRFHAVYGETFVMPKAKAQEESMYIPGTDGAKMSKSKGNTINIFLPEKQLRKQIMSIETDSTPLEEPKDPNTCNVFALYKLIASEKDIAIMRTNYLAGNYGYGHAKQALFDLLIEKFAEQRKLFIYYMENQIELERALKTGAQKATLVANDVLKRVRTKVGY
ncbi:MAG: tryptophan--tRNA ligase, partial [Flavobacteriia bacterium]|nr:tryptophan--tRNA ligase [Flavobacteriia bacterium]